MENEMHNPVYCKVKIRKDESSKGCSQLSQVLFPNYLHCSFRNITQLPFRPTRHAIRLTTDCPPLKGVGETKVPASKVYMLKYS